ncbi:major facilitator transporter [Caballeronia arationis]|uniref:Sugar phosphate permease n=2 Tax=Caballeronia arationis TaxID=1777142 RepID=A0A7Z7N2C7_9BURK|nr:MFS transporter [Caballeronia arationis]SAK99604.1 major facilitator transporter [Caballeronia arationis]SOE64919.1 Sugar phosphate permease [Caballeronia arationis]
MNQNVSAGARLDRLPMARFHWKILGLIGAGAALDAFDVYLAAGVAAAMVKQGFSTLQLNGIFVSAGFFGMLIGAGFSGYLGDRFGRRSSYQINLALFGLTSIAAAFAPSIYWLIGLRFVMGIGLGAELVVAAGTLCEFIPPAHRGRWTALLALMINSGLLIATSIGYVIPALGWRWMFGIAGIGAVVVWVLRHSMPESPRWLESVGRLKEAEETVSAIEREVEAQRGPLPPCSRTQNLEVPPQPFRALLRRGMIGRTVTAAITVIAVNVAVYGFVAWLPTFFVREGRDVVTSLGFTLLMSFGAPAGALLGFFCADRLGRAKGLVAFSLATIVLGFIYPHMVANAAIACVGFTLVTCIYVVVTLGLFSYVPELFPTALRLRGTGTAGVCGRLASIITSYGAVLLYAQFGVLGVLVMVSGVLLLLVIAILSLGVDANQYSLEAVSPDTVILDEPFGLQNGDIAR